MKGKGKIKEEKAITIVALIITIVILIILAAVVISKIIDMNIVTLATKSTEDYASKQVEEEKAMDDLADYLDKAKVSKSEVTDIKLGEELGQTQININASLYDELYIETWCSSGNLYCSYNIKTIALEDTVKTYIGNGAFNGAGTWSAIGCSNSKVYLDSVIRDGGNYTSSSKITVYGIKY